jgi:hypothetical protein
MIEGGVKRCVAIGAPVLHAVFVPFLWLFSVCAGVVSRRFRTVRRITSAYMKACARESVKALRRNG